VSRKLADVLCEMLVNAGVKRSAMALSEMHSTLLSMLFRQGCDSDGHKRNPHRGTW